MGKGLALQFKTKYPSMFQDYRRYCQDGRLRPGGVFRRREGGKVILNVATKDHWKDASQYDWVQTCLDNLAKEIDGGVTSIAIPPLGCGLGGLEWNVVRGMILELAAKHPETEFEIYGESPLARKLTTTDPHPN
jgi:hypothetical protein